MMVWRVSRVVTRGAKIMKVTFTMESLTRESDLVARSYIACFCQKN